MGLLGEWPSLPLFACSGKSGSGNPNDYTALQAVQLEVY